MLLFSLVPFFGVALMADGMNTINQVFFDWSSFGSRSGQMWIFLTDVGTVLYGLAALYTFMRIDCVFVEMIVAVSNLGQIAIFTNHSLVGDDLFSPLDLPLWEVNICAAVISVLYAVAPEVSRYLSTNDASRSSLLASPNEDVPLEVARDPSGQPEAHEEDKQNRILASSIGRFYCAAVEDGVGFSAFLGNAVYSELDEVDPSG
jgi:hypothetical protein